MKAKHAFEPAPRRGALHRLTERELPRLAEGNHGDGGGLFLQVKGGSKRWFFKYERDGHTHYVPFGALADRKLAEVRRKAQDCRNLLADAKDPKQEYERRAAAEQEAARAKQASAARDAATLEAVARSYHSAHLGDWTAKHGAQWLTSLENHVFAKLGSRPVAEIKPAELLDILLPLRADKPETGQRVRERLDIVFADAILREQCDSNPAAAIRVALRGKKRARKHHASLHWSAVPAFVKTLRTSERLGIASALAFEFLIITAARTNEVLAAQWGEIDLKARTWTIPAERMKARKPHVVYLAERAVEILREIAPLRAVDPATGNHKPSDAVFPSPQRATRPMSNMVFLVALKRLGLWGPKVPEAKRITAHGFRATFSTWANEHGHSPDVIEAALAHGESNAVRAAYNRAQYVEQRRALADAWADHCEGTTPKQRAGKRLRVVAGGKS